MTSGPKLTCVISRPTVPAIAQAILDPCRGRFPAVKERSGMIKRNPGTVRQEIPQRSADGSLGRDRLGRSWKYRLPGSERSSGQTAEQSIAQTHTEPADRGESYPQASPQTSPQSTGGYPQSEPAADFPTDVILRLAGRRALNADTRATDTTNPAPHP